MEETATNHAFWQDLEDPDDEIVTEIIYSCAETPPKRCDESVRRLCLIKWSTIPNFDDLPIWTNNKHKEYRQICYEVQMLFDGAQLAFTVTYDGHEVAAQNVVVDFSSGRESYRVVES